jgi:hypothetical protein
MTKKITKAIYFLGFQKQTFKALLPIGALLLFFLVSPVIIAGTYQTITLQQNDAFRWDVIKYVQQEAEHDTAFNARNKNSAKTLDARWVNGGSPDLIKWAASVSIYKNGEEIGSGKASNHFLSKTLSKATQIACKNAHLQSSELKSIRIKVTFYYPPDGRQYSMISDKNNPDWAQELIGNIIPVRQMDTALLKEVIQLEKSYLLRMMDPESHAFFKHYDAKNDKNDSKIRTISTASSLFTLLKVNNISSDSAIEQQIKPIAKFLLMMQEHTGKNAGAFHYSYSKKTNKKDQHFVVGTASKTIFTLLMLYEATHDEKYINAAKKAGNWLVTKVDTQGYVSPAVKIVNGQEVQIKRQSFLYSGQVLSALSRLYAVTHDQHYYNAATHIANRMVDTVEKKGAFVGDSFRTPNSVTTSRIVMALVDYAKINPEIKYRDTITQSAQALVHHQIDASWDAFNEGRLMDIITTSGNGWVNEVMTALYPFCKNHKMSGCASYKHFIIHSSRWLIQNVYTDQNMFAIKNPLNAKGGVMRNFAEKTVRTNAVCHGLNSLVGLQSIVGKENQSLQFLPERPIDEVIGLLEMGGKADI